MHERTLLVLNVSHFKIVAELVEQLKSNLRFKDIALVDSPFSKDLGVNSDRKSFESIFLG